MVRCNTVLGTDTKQKFQQKKSKVKVIVAGALPQPVALIRIIAFFFKGRFFSGAQ